MTHMGIDRQHLERFTRALGVVEGDRRGRIVEHELGLGGEIRAHVGAEAEIIPGQVRNRGDDEDDAAREHEQRGELLADRQSREHG